VKISNRGSLPISALEYSAEEGLHYQLLIKKKDFSRLLLYSINRLEK